MQIRIRPPNLPSASSASGTDRTYRKGELTLMTYQYFTPGDAEQYAYYRIPKMLITDKQFRGITMEAKLLYGILLDRVSLSLKNGWVDENNHIYIIFTIEQIMQEMNCGNKKAVSLLSELEKKIHLVEKKRQGLGKPNLLYVKNFFLCSDIHTDGTENVDNLPSEGKGCAEMSEGNAQRCQKDKSGGVVEEALEVSKGHGTNTNITKTDMSNTDPILSYLILPVMETLSRSLSMGLMDTMG